MTDRRTLQRRPELQEQWKQAVDLRLREETAEEKAHGAVAVLLSIASDLGRSMSSRVGGVANSP